MKKKLIPLILALVCAIACAFGLAACDDGGKDVIGVCLSTAANPTEKQERADLGNYVYGEDDKINDALQNSVKFYKQFFNNTYEEVAESELTVKYEKDGETLSEKPVKFTGAKQNNKSYYTFTYSIKGATNTCYVTFTVDKATSEDFTVTLSKDTWRYGEKTANFTLKNPDGTAMQNVDSNGILKADDTDYAGVRLFAMKKTDYSQAGATVKSYSALTTTEEDETKPNHGYNKHFGEKLFGFIENFDQDIPQGEYVLIACIGSTHNYKEIVCAADFTVTAPDTPFGKTFVLTDLTVRGDGGNAAPDEYLEMVENMKPDHLGQTAVCDLQGNVTGTFDMIDETAFNDLTGDDALTLTFGKDEDEYSSADPLYVSVKNGYEDQQKIELTGWYVGGKLCLTLRQETEGGTVYWDLTFELQSAN